MEKKSSFPHTILHLYQRQCILSVYISFLYIYVSKNHPRSILYNPRCHASNTRWCRDRRGTFCSGRGWFCVGWKYLGQRNGFRKCHYESCTSCRARCQNFGKRQSRRSIYLWSHQRKCPCGRATRVDGDCTNCRRYSMPNIGGSSRRCDSGKDCDERCVDRRPASQIRPTIPFSTHERRGFCIRSVKRTTYSVQRVTNMTHD